MIQGGLKRTEDLKHVPLMQQLVDDARTKQVIEFISAGSAIGRALIAPSKYRPTALRRCGRRSISSPWTRLSVPMPKSGRLDLEPAPGQAVQGFSDTIAKAPKDVVDAAALAMAAEKKR